MLKMSRKSGGMPGFSGILAMASVYMFNVSCPPMTGTHELGQSVASEIPGERTSRWPPHSSLSASSIVHKFVNEGNSNLLDLTLWVGYLPDEDIAGGVYAAFGVSVKHDSTLCGELI